MQLNMYLISVIGRAKLPHSLIEQVEGALKAQLENLHAEVNEAIDAAHDGLGRTFAIRSRSVRRHWQTLRLKPRCNQRRLYREVTSGAL
jgi:hypothetical protein